MGTTKVRISLSPTSATVKFNNVRTIKCGPQKILNILSAYHHQTQSTPILPRNCVYCAKKHKTTLIALEFEPAVYNVRYEGRLKFSAIPDKNVDIIWDIKDSSVTHIREFEALWGKKGYFYEEHKNTSEYHRYLSISGEVGGSSEDDILSFNLGGTAIFKVPTPRTLYVAVLGFRGCTSYVRKDFLFALQNPLWGMDDSVYRYPFGNVDEYDHHICWGKASSPENLSNLSKLEEVMDNFFVSPFNSDLDSNDKWNVHAAGLNEDDYNGTLALFNYLHNKKKVPDEVLTGRQRFSDAIDAIMSVYS